MNSAYRLVENARLDARNTFAVPARAPLLVEVADAAALPAIFRDGVLGDGPVLVLGGGSNLLFAGDPEGAVLALGGQDIRMLDARRADQGRVVVRADAGVEWHALVLWTLAQGLAGLENLALIPGTVGAAPIQNIGAYGVEVCETIHAVEAFDRHGPGMRRLAPEECAFAYRDSLFKREPGRFVVTAVEFALSRDAAPRMDYTGLARELAAMGVDAEPRASQVAEAVIRIRRRKLPDPAVVGNAGSFFKNPIVPRALADALAAQHPGLPVFPVAPFPADAAAHGESGDGGLRKLSAAWLIDACGWKGHRRGDAGVADSHALVLVNHGTATGAQLLELARDIADSVRDRFDVSLEPEPRIVGATW
jgi:UDP-N-acetylmuramate dehydrogenase